MCKKTNSLKLCTCNSLEDPLNFWSYSRPDSINNEMIIGEIVAPYSFQSHLNNSKSDYISNLLNKENCFDIAIKHLENDRLLLQIELEKGDIMKFFFKYIDNSWVNIDDNN